MLVTFIIGLMSMLFAFIGWARRNTKWLILSFLTIFGYLALRYDFGSDYMTYYALYKDIQSSSWVDVQNIANFNRFREVMEFGYIYLNKVFSTFMGFFFFIAFHSFLFCLVYFLLIKKYVQFKYAWLALFILVFNTNLLVRSLSGLRQGLAVFCFIFSIRYLIDRNFIKYTTCILLAASFHYSAIIMFPLFFLLSNKEINRVEPYIYIIIYLFMIFVGSYFLNPITAFVDYYLPKYTTYTEDHKTKLIDSGIVLITNSLLYIVMLFTAVKTTPADRVFYRILAVFIILSPLSLILGGMGRLSLYAAPALVVVVPNLMNTKFDFWVKSMFITLLLLITIFLASLHYTAPINYKINYTYKTIFSAKDF